MVVREPLKERLQRAGEQRGDPIYEERHELRLVAVGGPGNRLDDEGEHACEGKEDAVEATGSLEVHVEAEDEQYEECNMLNDVEDGEL